MLRNDDKMKQMIGVLAKTPSPIKIDALSMQLNMNRRTVQNYISAAKTNGVNIVSIPGRNGGVTIGK